jgi:hypothetical protein
MQRSVVGSIYGYLVCLLAIVIFVHSSAGIVNSVFGMASPASGFGAPMGARVFGSERGPGNIFLRTLPSPNVNVSENSRITVRTAFAGEGRLQAARMFVVSLVLLVISILLFGWHWRWLHGTQPA